jgi:hypothetical protein
MPNPLNLGMRLVLASILVLWVAHQYQRALVSPLLPVFRAVLTAALPDFHILGIEVSNSGKSERVRLRANLARSVKIAGTEAHPINGWYSVTLTVGGVLMYSLLTCIVVLAWPFAIWRELFVRVVIAVPLITALILTNVAVTFPAELWFPFHADLEPDATWPLLRWSRILMGGGGLVAGIVMGAMAIIAAKRLTVARYPAGLS